MMSCRAKCNATTFHFGYAISKVCLGLCGAEIRISVANGTVRSYVTGNACGFLWLLSAGMTLCAGGSLCYYVLDKLKVVFNSATRDT